MKRSVVVLGFLGLVWAAAMPAASAAVCFKEDFSTDAILKASTTYIQGRGGGILGDSTQLPFYIRDGQLWSSPEGSTGGSDNVVEGAEPDTTLRYLLLVGEPAWSDVTETVKIRIDSQNTGVVGLVVRAAPKTKPADPDTWYEFRYSTGTPPASPAEEAAGITAPEFEPQVRIMKVVNGKYTLLAQSTEGQEGIPAINANGDQNESGAFFRFKATGDVLEGFISLNGTDFKQVLAAKDSELKAGRVGLVHHDYNPVFDDLVVDCQ